MIIDLSHTISPEMPVYPESPQPSFRDLNLYDEFGVNVQNYSFDGHTGTHIDVPYHKYKEGKTIIDLDINCFLGKAIIVNCLDCDEKIPKDKFLCLEDFDGLKFVLINTGFNKKWGSSEYFRNFPILTIDALKYIESLGITGIGLDTISIDSVGDEELKNHKQWLKGDNIIIENLANLDAINSNTFEFSCLPLKFSNGDGSPVRACAIL